jgi:hypothetical protein
MTEAKVGREPDRDLLGALVAHAKDHRDRLPVFNVVQPARDALLARARSLLDIIWPQFGDCTPFLSGDGLVLARLRLPNNGNVDVFHPSGALAASMHALHARTPIGSDERELVRDPLVKLGERLAMTIAKQHGIAGDALRLESLWERKAQGTRLPQEKGGLAAKTAVAVLEVLSSFRRYVEGMPVLGRASVYVGVGANTEVIRWGADLRIVEPEPVTVAPVIDAAAGARRVLEDLALRRPERPVTLEDFEPDSFQLGYISLGRRREQFVMQPVWVAVLTPRGSTTMGHVVAVPASERTFEAIAQGGRAAGALAAIAARAAR